MRKQLLVLSLALASLPLALNASERGGRTVTLSGTEFSVDTLYHAVVGPGTTQTSLKLTSTSTPERLLRVFYLTTDLTNPSISIEAGVANNKLSGGALTSTMGAKKTNTERTCFGGINTDFFITSGTASNGTSMVGAPVAMSVAESEIYRTGWQSNAWPNFYVDETGKPCIGAVNLSSGTLTYGESTLPVWGINESVANNEVTIYTPKYYGTVNQPSLDGKCVEIPAKLVDATFIEAGKNITMEITGEPTTTGTRAIGSDEFMLVAKGTSKEALAALTVGTRLTLYMKALCNNEEVFPKDLCTGNPWILHNGNVLDSENDRGDASARHPRSGIGYNADKTKLLMMVIDGRSAISSGVQTSELAHMMYYAGVDEAVNVDGGGSSTLWTSALGVRNNGSDGKERAVSSGMFTLINAPQDDVVTEIRFVDWAMEMPRYGIYTPKFYGYNQYGVLVDTDVKGVTISAPSSLGEVIDDGNTLFATGTGCAALTATLGDLTATIPVTIVTEAQISYRLPSVVIDNKREYSIEPQAQVRDDLMPLSPIALSWASADQAIATVDNKGVIRGVANGVTQVTGTLDTFSSPIDVTVEIPDGDAMTIYPEINPADWTLSQYGSTNIAIADEGDGFKLTFVGNGSGRSPYVQAKNMVRLWSLPSKIRLAVNPGDVTVKKVTLNATNAYGENTATWIVAETELPKNEVSVIEANLSDWCNPDDIGVYPITLNLVRFELGATDKTEHAITVSRIETVYGDGGGSVETITIGKAEIYPNPVAQGSAVTIKAQGNATARIFSLSGIQVAAVDFTDSTCLSTADLTAGIYLVKVSTATSAKVAKLIVK